MPKILYHLCIVACLGLLLTSCTSLQPITIQKINGAQLGKISLKGIQAKISADVLNPNKIGLNIYKASLNVKINNIDLGVVTIPDKIKIKPNGNHPCDFTANADFPALTMPLVTQAMALKDAKSVNVEIKGTVTVGKFLIRKTFPIDIKSVVPLQK